MLERIDNDQLRVYVDLNYNEHAAKSLHFFGSRSSYGGQLNEVTRAIEFFEFEIEPNSKKLEFTIIDPQVIIRGPWEFEFSAERYFQ